MFELKLEKHEFSKPAEEPGLRNLWVTYYRWALFATWRHPAPTPTSFSSPPQIEKFITWGDTPEEALSKMQVEVLFYIGEGCSSHLLEAVDELKASEWTELPKAEEGDR